MTKALQNHQIVTLESSMPFFMRMHKKKQSYDRQNLMEHWHRSLELTYVYSGPTDFFIDGVCSHGTAGDVQIINCGCIHRIVPGYTEINNEDDAFTLIIGYDFLKAIVPDLDHIIFRIDGAEIENKIREKILEIANSYQKNQSNYKNIEMIGFVYELIYLLCEYCKENKDIILINSQKNREKIRGIMEYVKEHYKENITQAEVAKQFYFSREHFSRFFKKCAGITFKEYLTRYRLKQAEKELRSSETTILDIALSTGFTDARQFINSFKKYYDITPHQYRKVKG